jgi:hypothetical protein
VGGDYVYRMCDTTEYMKKHRIDAERDKVLAEHGLADRCAADFCLHPRTRQLVSIQRHQEESPDAQVAAGKPMVVMIAVPDSVPSHVFSTVGDEIWNWLDDDAGRRYAPDTAGPYLRSKAKGMFGGVIIEERSNREPTTYLAIERTGVIESATFDKVAWIRDGRLFYHAAAIVGRAWQFLGFCCDFYRRFAPNVGFFFTLGIRNSAGAILCGFAQGWREPNDPLSSAEPCVEPGLRFIRDGLRSDASPEQIEDLVRDLATDLGNAWGHREARCYAHPQLDPKRPFATTGFQSFTYSR